MAQLCYQLDGIPLAIELAAARVRALPVEQINNRLGESGEDQSEAMHRRQCDWCAAPAEEAEPHLSGALQAVWLSRLEAEHDNLRAALLRCEQAQEPGSRRAMLRLAGALQSFWDMRGHFSEGRVWLNKTLDCTHTLLDVQKDSQEQDTRDLLSLRAKLLNGAGILADAQGDYSAAKALYQECLEIRRQLGERQNVARSLNNLGEVARAQGDYAAAGALYRECLEILREFGEQRGIAISLNNLGNVAYAQGDYSAAHALYHECLEISRRLGDEQGVADSLGNLGALTEAQGDHSSARVLHQECLDILRRLGDQQGVAYSLGNLGNVACVQGDYTAARALYQEYLGISRQIGDQQGIASSLEGIAKLALSQKDVERSVRVLSAAAALRDRIGSQLNQKQQQERGSDLEAARAALGDAAFETAWTEGQALSGEQAAEYALDESN